MALQELWLEDFLFVGIILFASGHHFVLMSLLLESCSKVCMEAMEMH